MSDPDPLDQAEAALKRAGAATERLRELPPYTHEDDVTTNRADVHLHVTLPSVPAAPEASPSSRPGRPLKLGATVGGAVGGLVAAGVALAKALGWL